MSAFSFNIISKTKNNISLLLEGDLNIENASVIFDQIIEYIGDYKTVDIKMDNILTIDLTFVLLLVSLQRKATDINKTLNVDFNFPVDSDFDSEEIRQMFES